MYNKKHAVLGIVALLFVFGTAFPGEAAENVKKPDPKAPVTVEADRLSFNDMTGDIFAQGNVSFEQNDSQVLTELLQGNSKVTRVWVNGKATLLQPGVKLEGTHLDYNYTKHDGKMEKATGQVDKEKADGSKVPIFVKGDEINVAPEEMELNNGWVTACPATKITCYHVEADKIELWPGKKLIAYNARFYIRNMHIYTLAKYEKDLTEGVGGSDFPSFDYNNKDGFMISQRIKYPLSQKVSAYTDLKYYTKEGFKPVFGVMDSEKNYSLKLEQGQYENGDHEWVKKEPEFSFSMNPYRIGSSVTANLFATLGQWKAGNISGSRQEYGVYLSKDPIKLSEKWNLKLGTGYNAIHYGYNDSSNNIWHFDASLEGRPTERLNLWTRYYYSDESGTSVYDYDKIDNARELDAGFMYKVDGKNSIGVNNIFDLEERYLKDVDYTWKHDLHCWDVTVTYRAKRSEWNMKLSTLHW